MLSASPYNRPPENCTIHEIMLENIVQSDRLRNNLNCVERTLSRNSQLGL